MTIAIDARIINTSTGRYTYRLIEHLQKIDHQNQYVVLLLKKDFDSWEPSAPNFRKVMADFQQYSFAEQLGFAWMLYRLKPDLVHFTALHHPLLYTRPYIITAHDLTLISYVNRRRDVSFVMDFYKHRIKPMVFKLAIRWGFNFASHIITPTQYVRNQVLYRFKLSPKKVSYTYEAGDKLSAKAVAIPELKNKKFIMFVGNAHPYKNLDRLITAFTLVRQNIPDLHLVLAGKREFFYEQLEERVTRERLKNIIFPGFVTDEQLAWMYQHTQAMIYPSLSEGFGIPGLEAMIYGTPLISSNATCLPEVYGDAAAYFNPKHINEMAEVIGEVISDPRKLKELSTIGPKQAAKYSWQRMAEQTHQIYQQILKD